MPDIVAGIHRAAPAGPDDGQVPGMVAEPGGLAAQHRVLMPEHEQLGVPGRLSPG
jgi:hypothetical protein